MAFSTTDILGIPVVTCTTACFIDWLTGAARSPGRRPLFVTYLNAHCSNIAAADAAYAQLLQAADAVYADGKSIVWASRLLGPPLPERVNAADFILDFCRVAAQRDVSLYLLGSADGVTSAAAHAFRAAEPGLKVLGAESGYFTDGGAAAVARIAEAAPGILIVGMGVPLQEKWVWANLDRLNVGAVWCVGAMMEFYGGYRRRAPQWMCRAGLEWLWRLCLEPGRLWRRYLGGNLRFVLRVARSLMARRRASG